jgi:cation-transporting P-type ATPase E
MNIPVGLSEQEAALRHRRGEGNQFESRTGRTYFEIVRTNLFTFFNNILFVIGIALIALGHVNDAMTSVGLGLVNAIISMFHEIAAKRKLDRIALVSRPQVSVLRDSEERVIRAARIVRGDILHVRTGDPIIVDGRLVGGALEVDESLLTGESDAVSKHIGDTLLSGSFCMTGDAYYEAEAVGAQSFASQLTVAARHFRLAHTPLQKKLSLVVRTIMLVVAVVSGIILLGALLQNRPTIRIVQLAAVLTGQVPYGLFFITVVAYGLAAAKISKRGALVQQINAIESLSNVDVICMDKTGTLTANRVAYHDASPVGEISREALTRLLGDFVRSTSTANRTSEAVIAALPGRKHTLIDEIPFTSSLKWGAVVCDDKKMRGVYVLGALEALRAHLPEDGAAGPDGSLSTRVRAWAEEGFRVLAFAHNPESMKLPRYEQGKPELPVLMPLGLVAFREVLRSEAKETIAEFTRLGIRLKILSGDDPRTVETLARQVGMPASDRRVSGAELERMNQAEFDDLAEQAAIFGRLSPKQKERLVDALTRQGKYVAMIGDGINDVLALKKSRLGIAMQSGSNAARNSADMVLLNDSFGALLPALTEGRRIVSGMALTLKLFVVRVTTGLLVIIAITMTGLAFPFEPAQIALTLFTVGIPTFFLALWAQPDARQEGLFRSLLRFVAPAALVTMIIGSGIYTFIYMRVLHGISTLQISTSVAEKFEKFTGLTYDVSSGFGVAAATIAAQTGLSVFISYTAFLLILFLAPPIPFFTGWTTLSADKRPTLLAVGLILAFSGLTVTPVLSSYFGLVAGARPIYITLAVGVPLWTLAVRWLWRSRWIERFFAMEKTEG